MAGHQRSASWPSMVPPNKIKIDKALHSISSVISSPSATIEMVCKGLRRLGDIYSCISEIICLHRGQVHGMRLEEEMERLLEVLDLCNTMQESFTDLKMTILVSPYLIQLTQLSCVLQKKKRKKKMTILDLQMVLNRGDLAVVRVKAQSYVRLVKKAKHHLKKAINKTTSSEDGWLVSLLTTARGITVSALKSAVELLSKQMATCNASKWSLISKSSQKRIVLCEEVQWQALELDIVGLESSVENLFRSLIQTRVSLLNTQLVDSPLVRCDWYPTFRGPVNRHEIL